MNMRDLLKNSTSALIIGIVAGLVLGLILGWGIWPVQWENAEISHLRADLQEDYLRTTINSYALDQNATKAQERWANLGEAGPTALAAIEANPDGLNITFIEAFKLQVAGAPAGEAGEEESGTPQFLVFFCILTLVLGLGLGAAYMFRRGRQAPVGEGMPYAARRAGSMVEAEDIPDYSGEMEPPLQQFMTTFMLGDDLFDDSFSIDSQAGEFLGECGVGIAETIAPGEPKKVNTFEVWLFDKNDIQTVTKVLMSEHSYDDLATRDRLAAKGEPVLAAPRATFELQTETLRLVATVVDMAFGDDPTLPANSYLDRLTVDLAIFPKES